jgi:hypothetical protein
VTGERVFTTNKAKRLPFDSMYSPRDRTFANSLVKIRLSQNFLKKGIETGGTSQLENYFPLFFSSPST